MLLAQILDARRGCRPIVARSDYVTATRVSDDCTVSRQGKLKISAEVARRTARREQAIQREVDRTDAAPDPRKIKSHAGRRAPIRPPSPSSTWETRHRGRAFGQAHVRGAGTVVRANSRAWSRSSPAAIPGSAARSRCFMRARARTLRSRYLTEQVHADETKRAVEAEGRRSKAVCAPSRTPMPCWRARAGRRRPLCPRCRPIARTTRTARGSRVQA